VVWFEIVYNIKYNMIYILGRIPIKCRKDKAINIQSIHVQELGDLNLFYLIREYQKLNVEFLVLLFSSSTLSQTVFAWEYNNVKETLSCMYVMRRCEENISRAVMNWNPVGKIILSLALENMVGCCGKIR